nr:type II toxin-antitoxin system HicB family antitoxin [Mesorhizobium sp.]
MKQFLAIVEKDEESAFGVSFPDIPGCFSAADEEADILANAIEALELWAEDMKVPEPSPHGAIVSHADVAEALKAGSYLISVPLIEKDTAVVRANLTFERGMLRAIDETAKSRGLTRSAFLADAARRAIGAR